MNEKIKELRGLMGSDKDKKKQQSMTTTQHSMMHFKSTKRKEFNFNK